MNRSKFTKNLCKLVTIQSASYQTKVMMRYIRGVVQSIGGCTMSFDDYGKHRLDMCGIARASL